MAEFDVHQFLNTYFAMALEATDVSAFTELFTPDGVLEDPVGTPPLRGREAIGQFLAAGRSLIERSKYEIREVLSCGYESAVRWSAVVMTKGGDCITIEGSGSSPSTTSISSVTCESSTTSGNSRRSSPLEAAYAISRLCEALKVE